MPSIANDVRVAVRRARKRPGFTLVALLSLTPVTIIEVAKLIRAARSKGQLRADS